MQTHITGWTTKAKGALAGTGTLASFPRFCLRSDSSLTSISFSASFAVLAALFGMLAVVWYAFVGGQLDEEELEAEVHRELEEKKQGGFIKKGIAGLTGGNKQ